MEYQYLVEMFETLSFLKHKYPVLGNYLKYLTKIKDDKDKQDTEVTCFKTFLKQNPSIADKVLQRPVFITGKLSLDIGFDDIFTLGSPNSNDELWAKLNQMDIICFPDGKPTLKTVQFAPEGPLEMLESIPILKDVMDQVMLTASSIKPGENIATVLESPVFLNIVKTMKGNIDSGRYKLSDLTKMLTDVMGSISTADMDTESKEALNTLVSSMDEQSSVNPPPMDKLLNVIKNMQFGSDST